jgi:hypothetical protein
MAPAVEVDVTAYPIQICLFRADAVLFVPDFVAQPIEKSRLLRRSRSGHEVRGRHDER